MIDERVNALFLVCSMSARTLEEKTKGMNGLKKVETKILGSRYSAFLLVFHLHDRIGSPFTKDKTL